MTHEDAGHYAAKHPPKTELKPEVEKKIREKLQGDTITCAAAHAVASDLAIAPADVGVALDLMEARIEKCQMGLFGYSPEKCIVKPAPEVVPQLRKAIEQALVDNRLPCLAAWDSAKKLGIAKMDVAAACEALKIKICTCQIGAFK